MALFSKYSGSATEESPFGLDRYPTALNALEVNFGTDDDGDHLADWDGLRLWFVARGNDQEMLVIQGHLDERPPEGDRAEVLAALNEWNREKFFPKAYVHEPHEGFLPISTDVTVDLETGATDAMVKQQVMLAISTNLQLVDFLQEKFPNRDAWRKPAQS